MTLNLHFEQIVGEYTIPLVLLDNAVSQYVAGSFTFVSHNISDAEAFGVCDLPSHSLRRQFSLLQWRSWVCVPTIVTFDKIFLKWQTKYKDRQTT